MSDLSELPPPEPDAPPGYYPDPLGGPYHRWWDGESWATQVGSLVDPGPPKDVLVPDQPRPASALIGAAFRVYGRYPWLFPTLAAAVLVPYHLLVLAVTGDGPYAQDESDATAPAVLTFVQPLLVVPLISALHVHAVADVHAGEEPVLREVFVRGLRALPVVVATTIMAFLGVVVGLIALIVPGVILFFRWFVAAQVAAIDNEGWLEALQKSRELAKENWGHILVVIILTALVVFIPGLAPVTLGAEDGPVPFVVALLCDLVIISFTALTTALLYFDLRARRERRPEPAEGA